MAYAGGGREDVDADVGLIQDVGDKVRVGIRMLGKPLHDFSIAFVSNEC